jgi:hypothetical protein
MRRPFLRYGMKSMVTENVETDLHLTNVARGTVVGCIYHPDEARPTNPDSSQVSLTVMFATLFIFVKVDRM